jgi:hypothetical protein
MTDLEREPYRLLADVDRLRYERDRLNLEGLAGSEQDHEYAIA